MGNGFILLNKLGGDLNTPEKMDQTDTVTPAGTLILRRRLIITGPPVQAYRLNGEGYSGMKACLCLK